MNMGFVWISSRTVHATLRWCIVFYWFNVVIGVKRSKMFWVGRTASTRDKIIIFQSKIITIIMVSKSFFYPYTILNYSVAAGTTMCTWEGSTQENIGAFEGLSSITCKVKNFSEAERGYRALISTSPLTSPPEQKMNNEIHGNKMRLAQRFQL